ncbi:MAG: carboxymuconolactone decarboxylase family protein [Acidimicrobiales bacterium]
MPRLRQVPRSEAADPAVIKAYDRLFGPDRDPVASPGTATGTPGNWWTVFALSPEVLRHAVAGFALYQGSAGRLDPTLRELGQTRAGWLVGSQFVYSQHCKSCRALGMPEEKIAAIAGWGVSEHFNEVERAVLAYTDSIVADRGRVADAVFEALRRHLSDEQILDLTYITAMYAMHAAMSRALRLEYDDVAERITEVAAPQAESGRDIGADISGATGD